MSERTAPSLAKLDALLPRIAELPSSPTRTHLTEDTEALRRAVAAFHMEAIRFRMHSVDRLIHAAGDPSAVRQAFEDVRQALETAGFHTRSHAAPGQKDGTQA
jgi:hypothetical protein